MNQRSLKHPIRPGMTDLATDRRVPRIQEWLAEKPSYTMPLTFRMGNVIQL